MNLNRNTYIENMDVDEAKKLYIENLNFNGEAQKISVLDSLNRVTYEAVYAKNSSPHYNAAAMDGICVRAKNTEGATESNPKILEEHKDFLYINTGNPIIEPYDSVIMIEDVIVLEGGKIKILKASHPWQHIRPIGEDIVATEMILPSKHKIRPIDIGALISGGIEELSVYKKPRVGILPTGTEIVETIGTNKPGEIPDSNSRVFEALISELGGLAKRYTPVADDYDLLKSTILSALKENDILLINAGSSAGTKDYTVHLIKELGQVLVHGVALKPGKPTILGIIDNKPVIGIPGYPVSSFFVFETFVKPIILNYCGLKNLPESTVEATVSKTISSSLKSEHLIRVNLGLVDDSLIATPLSGGAGVTMSLVKADGVLTIPRNIEGIEAGQKANVRLLKPLSSIENSIVSIGSHDLIMDVISDMMDLTSGHVGSMGGILAKLRGECHLAPIHLLDEETGEYNISYIKKYFPNKKMALIKGIKRLQGFIVKKGNPDNINGFEDLVGENISFVNRQRGAGTRILLDFNIKELNIIPEDIVGYTRELNTHMAVAMAVKTGSATTGLGIYSAAKSLGLDFIKVAFEDYDFLIEEKDLNNPKIQNFIGILQSEEFKNRVLALGGYEFENPGEVIIIK